MLELETDKAVVEVPSTLSGTVSEVKVKVGQKLKVGDVIFTIAATAGSRTYADRACSGGNARRGRKMPRPRRTPDHNYMAMARHSYRAARTAEGRSEEQAFPPDAPPEIESEAHPAGLTKHAGHEHRTVPAAPIVRKLAREIGVDIYLVKGSGPGGRISEDDVKAFAKGAFARMADAEASVAGLARGSDGGQAAGLQPLGQDRKGFAAWSAAQDGAASGVGMELDSSRYAIR